MDDKDGNTGAEIWASFCDQLKLAGQRLLDGPALSEPQRQAEALRHLTRLLTTSIQLSVENADADAPRFSRLNNTGAYLTHEDVSWLVAPVRNGAAYRVTGNVSRLHDVNVAVHLDSPHRGPSVGNLGLDELAIGPSGEVTLIASDAPPPGNSITLPPGAKYLSIREYYYDWPSERPGQFQIERIDGAAPPRPSLSTASNQLGKTSDWISTYLGQMAASAARMAQDDANVLSAPASSPNGSSHILYGWGHFALGDGECLIIDFEAPQARHWTVQWLVLPFFSNPDVVHRSTSVRGSDAHVDPDGRVRIVVSHDDPGVKNWLDVRGYRTGALFYRWIRSQTAPHPRTRLIPRERLFEVLFDDVPRYGPDQRKQQLAVRQSHFSLVGR